MVAPSAGGACVGRDDNHLSCVIQQGKAKAGDGSVPVGGRLPGPCDLSQSTARRQEDAVHVPLPACGLGEPGLEGHLPPVVECRNAGKSKEAPVPVWR